MNSRSDGVVPFDGCAVRVVDADKVAAVRAAAPADGDVAELADVFALLGDPSRLRILTALAEGGEMCVCDVAATVGMSESAASHALRLLRAHRIVEPRRAGRMTFYRLADAHVRVLLDVALSHTQHTDAMHPERDASDGHPHGPHDHGGDATTDVNALRVALALIVGFMVLEVAVAVLAHSLALLADAGHMLTDAAALGTALWAIRLAARPASPTWSFGLKRAEILSAAVNGVTLVAVAGIVTVEAIRRLIHPGAVGGPAVLTVALVGVAVNVAASWALSRGNRSSLNVEGAFQHILTDAAGFIATAIAAIVIITTGFHRADAIASLVVVALMAHAAWGLLAASGRILLEGTPEHIDLAAVRARLLAADPHVVDVHDLHAWVLTSNLPAMTAHVVLDDSCFHDGHAPRVLDVLQHAMRHQFDMEHSTLQLEMAQHADHETGTH